MYHYKYLCSLFLILFVCINNASSLRCYDCSAEDATDKCYDPVASGLMPTKDCSTDITGKVSSIFKNVFQAGEHSPVCIKSVKLIGNSKLIKRDCAIADKDQVSLDTCATLMDNVVTTVSKVDIKVLFCGVCSTDGCNSASNIYLFIPLLILSTVLYISI